MKKTIFFDAELCVGCGACVVACMDQNDIFPEKGHQPFRRQYTIEDEIGIHYISIGCQHCEESPCMVACPIGAIQKDKITGSTVVNRDMCIGCHSCALACPFGVPRYDAEEKMQKCHLCAERVGAGLVPACVRVCPLGALKFDDVNHTLAEKEVAFADKLLRSSRRAITG